MKKILIYFTSVTGHNIEFIHHLYMGAMKRGVEAVFVVPATYEQQKSLFDWPSCPHIRFDLMPMAEVGSLADSIWKKSWRFSRLLRRYMDKNGIKTAFVADLLGLMPFLPLFMPVKYAIHGLIFNIYLYRWHTRARYKSLIEASIHWLMKITPAIKRIYVGNDSAAPKYLNRLFKTEKYLYIPDPVNDIEVAFCDMREKYGVSADKKILYHFGAMGGRKGTIQILESIALLPEEEAKRYCFVFAGVVQETKAFYDALEKVKDKCQILVFDQFCEFEFIAQWCQCCDAILMPYTQTHMSSGVIGYGAKYGKPLLGPGSGLIGKLMRRYHLGITLESISGETLSKAYAALFCQYAPQREYMKQNSTGRFCDVVYELH